MIKLKAIKTLTKIPKKKFKAKKTKFKNQN